MLSLSLRRAANVLSPRARLTTPASISASERKAAPIRRLVDLNLKRQTSIAAR